MADHPVSGSTDMWLRDIRDELRIIRGLLEMQSRPASSTDAATPAQPTSEGKRALPIPKKSQ